MSKDWTFAKVDGGWWLVIEDEAQLFEYHQQTDTNVIAPFLMENTPKTELSNKIEDLAKLREKSVVYAAGDLVQEIYLRQLHYLSEYGTLFINCAGGWNLGVPYEFKITRHKLVWPDFKESDIHIERWGQGAGWDGEKAGSHYYAHIGNLQVRDGDTWKWNTEAEAMTVARKYLTE